MIRENWRLILLAVLVVVSTAALFGPIGAGAGDDGGLPAGQTDSPTNLQYGLELSGGTRVRAPLVGLTAEPVDLSGTDTGQLQRDLAAELNVSLADVAVRPPTQESPQGAVEVLTKNVTRAEFASAMQANGFDVSEGDVRDGVTQRTRDQTVRVLNSKINEGGLTGGTVTTSRTPSGETYVLVEVPNANRSEVLDLIGTPGRVQVVALSPNANNTGFDREPLLDQNDLTVSGVTTRSTAGGTQYAVGVTISNPDAAERFANTMRQEGFTSQQNPNGIGNCEYELGSGPQDDSEYCLLTVRDDTVVYAASMGDLATTINNGQFVNNPTFSIGAPNQSAARQLEIDLRAGALPTTLDVEDEGTTYFLQPSLAQQFKLFSLVTGAVAVLAVSAVVFFRYREFGVAAPMILTAAAEVYLLLGFASLVGLALDLSHIAGFIAVIGTGVDDLIIIADEILQGERVKTGRVFESRFRKAFWVIGAAAATTIIAMSPLAVLSLGDLQGFALVTIVGVLLGVLVTRPAYGNILRNIVLD